MDKLELRARTRAAARDQGLLEIGRESADDSASEPRGRNSAARIKPAAPANIDAFDEAQAQAACKPMGELEYIVQAADASGRQRALYVVVPDPGLKSHYQRLGFEIDAGCRVLLDATELIPIAVLRVTARSGDGAPPRAEAATGFNPYFDLRST